MTDKEMKIVAIEHAINVNIEGAKFEFNHFGSSEYYNRLYSRICGMIDVLKILTGKDYYFDENGLHEHKA